jgi:hypothetical protein
MPAKATFQPLFSGHFVTLLVADAESVLLSKALKTARKNLPLLTEYLARGPSARFLKLAQKYTWTEVAVLRRSLREPEAALLKEPKEGAPSGAQRDRD